MPDIESSQFNSFLFWKLPIPEMDPRELALTLAPALCRSQKSVANSASGGATSHARPTPPHKLPLTLDQAPNSEFVSFFIISSRDIELL
uniref:Putative WW-binding domain-containing protein n=1 Tax=Eptatretus burgeri TaxID=7764 RepID=A0A8C4Q5P6_EPTBU